jgi:hypothetical protein
MRACAEIAPAMTDLRVNRQEARQEMSSVIGVESDAQGPLPDNATRIRLRRILGLPVDCDQTNDVPYVKLAAPMVRYSKVTSARPVYISAN